jgi:hypothetical protein
MLRALDATGANINKLPDNYVKYGPVALRRRRRRAFAIGAHERHIGATAPVEANLF